MFRLIELLKRADVRLIYYIPVALLSFIGTIFEGLHVAILIPMARGIMELDFSFIKDLSVFKILSSHLPNFTAYVTRNNTSIFAFLMIAILGSIVLKHIFLLLSHLLLIWQKKRFSENIRDIIFSRYLKFGKLFFDRTSVGRLSTILIKSTGGVDVLLWNFRELFTGSFTLFVYFILMCLISWKLTILALLLFPLLNYSISWLIRKMKKTSNIYIESYMTAGWRIFDVLSSITLVKSYSNEKEERRRFKNIAGEIAQLSFSNEKKTLLINPIQEIIVISVILAIFSIAAYMFAKGHGTGIAGFLVFFYILRRATAPFAKLNQFRGVLARAEGEINTLFGILDSRDKFLVPEGELIFSGLKDGIRFKNVNFSYTQRVSVLKDISFRIEKGKITAIVGPTGSGKTTIINLIMRFYDCPASSLFIDGTDIRNFNIESLMKHAALVSQDTPLFNDKIRNNITYGLTRKVSEEELTGVVKKARLYDFVASLPGKFDTLIGDRGVKLSGGEKQRLSIARALLKGSEILILDEATSSLDSRTERLIQEAIDEAVKNKTAIVIAHRLSTIKNADKIIVIEGGKVAEEGRLQELLDKKGKFYEYWQEQKFD